jgi:hypothetical protein
VRRHQTWRFVRVDTAPDIARPKVACSLDRFFTRARLAAGCVAGVLLLYGHGARAQSTKVICSVDNANETYSLGTRGSAGNDLAGFSLDFSGPGAYGADLGAYVTDGTNHWIFFGDAMQNPSSVVAWQGGADAAGVYNGDLCGGMSLIQEYTSSASYSPDVVYSDEFNVDHDFIFDDKAPTQGSTFPHPVWPPLSAPYNVGIPGIDETPTGAIYNPLDGKIYLFYQGSPNADCWGGKNASVSYLVAWDNPTAVTPTTENPYPTTYRVVAGVDYSTTNNAALNPGTPSCQMTSLQEKPGNFADSDWPDPGFVCTSGAVGVGLGCTTHIQGGPMFGNFIKVQPVYDGSKFVYLFGTNGNPSQIHLGRIPMAELSHLAAVGGVQEFLAQDQEFKVWTTGGPGGTPHWSAGPPSPADYAYISPVTPTGVAHADTAWVTAQYYPSVLNGLWLLMYQRNGTTWLSYATGSAKPEALTWSSPVSVATSDNPTSNPQCTECDAASANCTPQFEFLDCEPAQGPSLYSPNLSPDPPVVDVSCSLGVCTATVHVDFTISTSVPYQSVRLKFPLSIPI